MNDDDPLERELAGVRPASPSPSLKRRIAARLEPSAAIPTRASRRIRLCVGGFLVAAMATGVLLWPRGQPAIERAPSEFETESVSTFDESLPSLWSYRKILNDSSISQDGHFDRSATPDSRPATESMRIYPSIRFDSETDPFPGDL